MENDQTQEAAIETQVSDTQVTADSAPEKSEETSSQKPATSIRAELRRNFIKEPGDEALMNAAKATPNDTKATATEEAILPPADMNAEERKEWEGLSNQAKKYLARRAHETRSDYSRRTEQLISREKEFQALSNLNLSQLRDEYAKQNIALPTVIENAVAWDRAFRANPKAAAADFLKSWGVNLAELGQQQYAPAQQQFSPETISELVQKEVNARLEAEQHKNYIQAQESSVQELIKDKPLFRDPGTAAQVEAAMIPIVKGLRLENPSLPAKEVLNRAYDLVTRGTPQFADLLSKIDGRAAAEKAKAETAKAQAASRTVTGGPGSGSPTKRVNSIREALRLARNDQL